MSELDDLARAVNYPSRPARPAPNYGAIKAGAAILNLVGLLYVITGLGSMVVGVLAIVNPPPATAVSGNIPSTWVVATPAFIFSLISIAGGVLQMTVASIALAIRDIARNSFAQ